MYFFNLTVPEGQEFERGSGGWFRLKMVHEVTVKMPVRAAASSEGSLGAGGPLSMWLAHRAGKLVLAVGRGLSASRCGPLHRAA